MNGAPREVQTHHVVLIGLMGAGKSTVGPLLAERLGRPWVDNDEFLERRTGRSAHEWLEQSGAERLHAAERLCAQEELGTSEPAVLALAASYVDDAAARDVLLPHYVVWLRAEADTLLAHIGPDAQRPFSDRLDVLLRAQHAERAEHFASVAKHIVDVDNRTPDSIVHELAAALDAWPADRQSR
jgi:shikimate kinase